MPFSRSIGPMLWMSFILFAQVGSAQVRLEDATVLAETDWITRLLGGFVLPDGGLVIVDRMSPELHRYGRDGKPRGQIGRKGRGPGELLRGWPAGLVGDTIWVADVAQRRLSFFSIEGTHHYTESFPVQRNSLYGMSTEPRWVASDGSLIAKESASTMALLDRPVDSVALFHVSREGESLKRIVGLRYGERPVLVKLPGGAILQTNQPWPYDDIEAVSATGDVLVVVSQDVDGATGVVKVRSFDPDGVPRSERSIRVPLEELGDEAVDAWVNTLYSDVSERMPSLSAMRRAVMREFDPPKYVPPVSGVFVTSDGVVWLERGPGWWIVLTPGAGEREVRSDRPINLSAVSSQSIWGTTSDELGRTSVYGYALPWAR